jgi:ubiquinone/menaquinone biosynthesis C-methylase UbiE
MKWNMTKLTKKLRRDRVLAHARKRWIDMDEEERVQEAKYLEYYGYGEKIKDVAGTFFLDYYENTNPLISIFSWKKIDYIVSQVKRIVNQKTAKILDLGCGIAYFFMKLGFGENQYGLDISRLFLNKAKNNAPWAHFIYTNAKKIPFEDNFFDFTVCNDVLEHVRYPVTVLHEIDRVTKKGNNHVILSIPNEFNCRLGRIITLRLPVNWPFHLHSITPDILRQHFPRSYQYRQSIPINHLPWWLTLDQVFFF